MTLQRGHARPADGGTHEPAKQVAPPPAQRHARATRILLREPLDEARIETTERAKRKHEQVARRQLLLSSERDEADGGRTVARRESRKRVCAWNVCSRASVVRACRLRTSTASSSPTPPSSSPPP